MRNHPILLFLVGIVSKVQDGVHFINFIICFLYMVKGSLRRDPIMNSVKYPAVLF